MGELASKFNMLFYFVIFVFFVDNSRFKAERKF